MTSAASSTWPGLPKCCRATLHLRQKMRIDSGLVRMTFGSRPEQQGTVWTGQLVADNLGGTLDQKQITWEKADFRRVRRPRHARRPRGPIACFASPISSRSRAPERRTT